ncbi:TetR family transcriptional regulator [Arthrobacter sp. JZ12]|uniref:TetR/AcrR family transcriptional regulator n=1 Tax=Arthrobacter sp. JZ12 TaxID=2654190 RepID=UPI002B48A46B|nr:TetR/AcrR family transcriptional regulator [Arthrobacter sp. JZ12]WRH25670.1 TetR family transcriptional regulator [Arthrobacter sp. JZ12]
MARPPKPERKNELLDQIVDYLLDKTFASLSFRTLADGLGISSYVLVYHFGNREELVNEIVRHIEARHDTLKLGNPAELSREEFRNWILESWKWLLADRNRNLQRLEFEAAVQDAASPHPRGSAVEKFQYWYSFTTDWLISQGMARDRAETASRVFSAGLYGLQYDYVLNHDPEAVGKALDMLVDQFLQLITTAVSASTGQE